MSDAKIGTPEVSSFPSIDSSTSLHSSSRPKSSMFTPPLSPSSASVAFPTSLLSSTKTMAWQLP